MLSNSGYEVLWDDGIAEEKTYDQWLKDLEHSCPDIIMIETKTPVVKKHWVIINDVKNILSASNVVLVGDHVTALPQESMDQSKVDFILTGGDYDFLLLNLANFLTGKAKGYEPGIWCRENGNIKKHRQLQVKS